MTIRGLLCSIDFARHRSERVPLLGLVRCADCGTVAENELELLGDRAEPFPDRRPAGYVRPGERRAFVRDDRYRAAV